jgi:hypothetical protein
MTEQDIHATAEDSQRDYFRGDTPTPRAVDPPRGTRVPGARL